MCVSFGIEEGVRKLLDAGYDALDFSFFLNLFDDAKAAGGVSFMKKLRKIAEERGIFFNQAHAPFGGGYDNYTTNLVPKFPEVFEYTAALGAKQIVVHPLQRGRYYGQEEELFKLNMEFYSSLVPLSERTGVKICLENMWHTHPLKKTIVDDTCANPYELCKYYDALNDSKHFTVCLDIGHVALCNREPEDAVRIIGHDRLGALHVHDVDYATDLHTLPGTAKVNHVEVAKALGEIDYKGEYTLEADNFLVGFPNDYKPAAAKFMAQTARYFANIVDQNRPQNKK